MGSEGHRISEDPETPSQTGTASGRSTRAGARGTDTTVERMARRIEELEHGYMRLLEAENRRLRVDAEALERSPAARPTTRDEISGAPIDVPSSGAVRGPAYLTSAVIEVERRCDEMDMYARLEDWAAARSAKLAAANTACRALRRVSEDREFTAKFREISKQASTYHEDVLSVVPGAAEAAGLAPSSKTSGAGAQAGAPAGGAPSPEGDSPWSQFLLQETELLQILGLSRELATEQITRGREAFVTSPKRYLQLAQTAEEFMDVLETLRGEVCMSADVIAQGIRSEISRKRWKKILVNGISGVFIVGVNSGATALLGPLGIAISGAFGSAAVSVAVETVNA
jgi:hypothetical protein